MSNADFEFIDEDDDLNTLEKIDENQPPYGSGEWEEYVMKQFLPHELYNESYPTLNGLRRIAILLFGKPVSSKPTSVICDLPNSTCCVYEIEFRDGSKYGALADGTTENISGDYALYLSPIAESRAESRAYRKALLISTASAEEIKGNEKTFSSVLKSVTEYKEEDPISSQQKSIIESKCKQLKIKLDKFLESENISFETAKKSDGTKLAKKLTEFQTYGVPKNLS